MAIFGRVYAAYGGIFIAMALVWGWLVDDVRPDRFELAGAALALVGVLVIMYAPRTYVRVRAIWRRQERGGIIRRGRR